MKKFFLITLIFMMGCVQSKSFIIYNEVYNSKEKDKVIYDINKTLYYLKMDSIPMDDWIPHYYQYSKEGYSIDRYVTKKDKKTIYYLIFSTYYYDSTYYEFQLRCYTKDRSLMEKN